MKNKIVAKLVPALAVVSAAFMFMGCGITTTTTYTETVTDEYGNTTSTTTTTVKDENGTSTTVVETSDADEMTEEEEITSTLASIHFDNETQFDMNEIYFASTLSDEWGNNILGDDDPLCDGEVLSFNNGFTYSSNNTQWDLKAVDAEGAEIEFSGLELANAENPEDITICVEYNADSDSYTAYVI